MEKYPTYLIHFNKNHSPKNGQFTSGDGDGDNIRDDHHNYSKNKGDLSDAPKEDAITGQQIKTVAQLLAIPGRLAAGLLFSKTAVGKLLNYGNKNLGWKNFTKDSNWKNYKVEQKANIKGEVDKLTNPLYDKAANFINKFI